MKKTGIIWIFFVVLFVNMATIALAQHNTMVKKISDLVSSPTMKTLRCRLITSYLLENGYLEKILLADGRIRKHPTEKGFALGIITEEREGTNGPYLVNLLNKKAQQLIIDNLSVILNANKEEKALTTYAPLSLTPIGREENQDRTLYTIFSIESFE